MQRFFIPAIRIKGDEIIIDDERVVYQASRVLRMREGDEFFVFEESGREYLIKISEIGKRQVIGGVVSEVKRDTEPRVKVSLFQAIPKKPALLELVVQKAAELGVAEVYPMITDRTEQRHGVRLERLRLIALEATEQCGGKHVLVIHEPIKFAQALKEVKNGFLGHFGEAARPIKELEVGNDVRLLIGPEGGFSENEVALAGAAGVKIFSLGPRTLRTETAAICALSHLLT
jgi:16S rRNA (uracil1498-N3)-methyltransferase